MNDSSAALRAAEVLHAAGHEDRRLLRLHFPHGDAPAGALLLAARLDADEGLGRDFRFEVEVLCDRPDLELKTLMGRRTKPLAR